MLVTERPGQLRVVSASGQVGTPVLGLPPIEVGGQGGLLNLTTDRDFAHNRMVYFCYAEPAGPGERGNSTAMASARLSDDAAQLE